MKILRSKLQGKIIQEIELVDGSEYLIGRSSECDICLNESREISRQHIKVSQDESSRWAVKLITKFGELSFNGEKTHQILLEESLLFHVSPYDIEFVIQPSVPVQDEEVSSEVPSEPPGTLVPQAQATEVSEGHVMDKEVTADGVSRLTAHVELLWTDRSPELIALEGDRWVSGRDDSADISIPKSISAGNSLRLKRKRGIFISLTWEVPMVHC